MKYATDWSETLAANEDATFEGLAARVVAVQASRTPTHGPGRALHRVPLEGIEARFVVRPDLAEVLPTPLHVGPFTPGASYRAYVRFSNGSWERKTKDAPDIRGIGMKLVGVGGEKLLTGSAEPRTQDFLMIQTPTSFTSDPSDFVSMVEAGAGGGEAGLLWRLGWKVGFLKAFKMLKLLFAGITVPFPSYASVRVTTLAPLRFGPTAARFGMVPTEPVPPAAKNIAAELRERVKKGFSWDFQAQLYQDPKATPIEDQTVTWDERVAPWITLARVEVPAQDPASPRGQKLAAYVETLSMDPWHGVTELRPLGAMNRVRKAVYFASSKNRPTAPEPDGSETFEQ